MNHSVVYITGPYDRGENYPSLNFKKVKKLAHFTMQIHINSMS